MINNYLIFPQYTEDDLRVDLENQEIDFKILKHKSLIKKK
mgnify:CR=1 FL=1